jgi:hypothetical protein
MATVVVGGHTRSVGKTSVVAGLISALPDFHWTAMKITQYGHSICSASGESCDCATDEHVWSLSEEHDRSGGSDTSRFLAAGAERVLWVRSQQGHLAEAMPALRSEFERARNLILESNSVMKFLRPDLYLAVLDPASGDFKRSAQEFLDRADAVILHETSPGATPAWKGVSLKPVAGRPVFRVRPPQYVTPEIAAFVRERLSAAGSTHLAVSSS